jgi:hypothetical protein
VDCSRDADFAGLFTGRGFRGLFTGRGSRGLFTGRGFRGLFTGRGSRGFFGRWPSRFSRDSISRITVRVWSPRNPRPVRNPKNQRPARHPRQRHVRNFIGDSPGLGLLRYHLRHAQLHLVRADGDRPHRRGD